MGADQATSTTPEGASSEIRRLPPLGCCSLTFLVCWVSEWHSQTLLAGGMQRRLHIPGPVAISPMCIWLPVQGKGIRYMAFLLQIDDDTPSALGLMRTHPPVP